MYWFLLLVSCFCAFAQRPVLQDLPVLSCASPVTLEVKQAWVNVGNQVAFTSRVYHVDGVPMFPGPTITAKAGTRCSITNKNSLSGTPCSLMTNQPECPQTVNVHVHGVHVSPSQDDVFVEIEPGESYTYTYDIPDNHLMGTHWFHPHFHGSSGLQVSGGLHGALLIEPADDYVLPADLEALYDSARTVVLSPMYFSASDAFGSAFDQDNYQAMNNMPGNTIDPNITITGDADFYAINGQYQPIVDIKPGEAQLFRFIHAAGIRILELELVDPTSKCQMQLLARDGVFQYTPYQKIEAIVLPQAGRADVVILCSAAAAGATIDVKANPSAARNDILGTGNRHSHPLVFSLRVAATQTTTRALATSSAVLPDYLTSLMEVTSLSNGQICPANTFVLAFGLTKKADLVYGTINNVVFPGLLAPEAKRYTDTQCLGEVYEMHFSLPTGGGGYGNDPNIPTGAHPLHVHVDPFQVVEGDGTPNGVVYRKGEWRDTISLKNPLTVRFSPRDFTGDYLLHCHIYVHGTKGMMGLLRVTDSCTAPKPCVVAEPEPEPEPDAENPDEPLIPDSAVTAAPSLVFLAVLMFLGF